MKPDIQEPDPPTRMEELVDHVKDYVDTRSELIILKSMDKISSATGRAVSLLVFIFLFIMILALLSLGAAAWIGKLLNSYFAGFFVMAGFYTLVGLVLYLGKEKFLRKPVSNKIIEEVLNE